MISNGPGFSGQGLGSKPVGRWWPKGDNIHCTW